MRLGNFKRRSAGHDGVCRDNTPPTPWNMIVGALADDGVLVLLVAACLQLATGLCPRGYLTLQRDEAPVISSTSEEMDGA